MAISLFMALTPEINPVPPAIVDGAIGALFSILVTLVWSAVARKKEVEKRLVELESKLALVNAAVAPISTVFLEILKKELTHFHTPEMDALLKLTPCNLTPDEEARLKVMLKERERDIGMEISESERDAAHMFPAVMRRAQQEQEQLKMALDLKLTIISIADLVVVANPVGEVEKEGGA